VERRGPLFAMRRDAMSKLADTLEVFGPDRAEEIVILRLALSSSMACRSRSIGQSAGRYRPALFPLFPPCFPLPAFVRSGPVSGYPSLNRHGPSDFWPPDLNLCCRANGPMNHRPVN